MNEKTFSKKKQRIFYRNMNLETRKWLISAVYGPYNNDTDIMNDPWKEGIWMGLGLLKYGYKENEKNKTVNIVNNEETLIRIKENRRLFSESVNVL